MSTITVSHPHGVDRSTARSSMTPFEEMMGKFGVTLAWSGDTAQIKGMGVSGSVTVDDTQVVISLKLGVMAKAAGVDPARLQRTIARRMSETFDDSSST
jgi:putative polyhydroxyalkanoate system protein